MVGRFAPTPSGRMHLGNITAMLAAWLSAHSSDSGAGRGRMLLRIEDIDTPRVMTDADRWIMDDLTWLGLDWDGEPAYQSQRLDLYEQALDALGWRNTASAAGSHNSAGDGGADNGAHRNPTTPLIYPCFCSRADIRAASAPQEGDRFIIYPGTCRRTLADDPQQVRDRLKRGDRHSLRIAMPAAGDPRNLMTFHDRVFGPQRFDLARDLGDTVVRRADGLFAYQLVVTVDDLLMGVNDVVRGRDLLRSTALQLYIRESLLSAGFDGVNAIGATDASHVETVAKARRQTAAIGAARNATAPIPSFAHLPLIDNAQGRRLAKRERSLDMGALRARGVTAHQVVGYCGWLLGLQPDPEPCSAADLLRVFSWDQVATDTADRRVPDDPFGVL
ncbi:glutamyl-Q tRNA(Asp) synthetase [Bifidobacterium leontopitheci]|uniref:glutamyl-Q tRNA(Asp) synthetase n=1 Tax=Bifidobacterium leontopitheci TaxID=2650774 RepID=UPI001D019A8B|nr:glutamyl-Q tRNA(Asp) synthetase [Bifidobacterium leontopitheci]